MKTLLLTYALLSGGDAAQTHAKIQSGIAREAWLPTQNVWAIDAMVAGQTVGVLWSLRKLNKIHPRLARVVGWTIVGARAAVVVQGMRVR